MGIAERRVGYVSHRFGIKIVADKETTHLEYSVQPSIAKELCTI